MRALLIVGLALLLQVPDLIVTLHDAAGAPLVGATVTVQDASGQLLAQAATDAGGMATFAQLPVSDVRVQVAGQPGRGPALQLMPSDAAAGGIRVYLTSADQINLIAAPDGTVILDPATMWAREPGVPVTPTATLFPTAPLPTTPSPPGSAGERAPLAAPPAPDAPAGIAAPPAAATPPVVAEPAPVELPGLPLFVLALLVVVLGGLLLALRGRGR